MNFARAIQLILTSAVVVSSAIPAALAAGAAPVALVMAVEGATTPRVEVHQELLPDTRIALAKGARISILHYVKCTILTVRGGSLLATEADVEAASGQVESSRPGPCPRVQRITVAGQSASSGVVISRAVPALRAIVSIAGGDEILLTGPLAPRAVSSELVDTQGKVVLGAAPIRAATISLAGGRMLTTGETYLLQIKVDGIDPAVNIPLAIVESRAAGPLILRLE